MPASAGFVKVALAAQATFPSTPIHRGRGPVLNAIIV